MFFRIRQDSSKKQSSPSRASSSRSPAMKLRRIPTFDQLESRELLTVSVLSSFRGPNLTEAGGFEPPDTQMAAGPNHVVVGTNVALAFYDKATGNRTFLQNFSQFFAPVNPAPNFSDPIVYFDERAQRFVVGILNFNFTDTSLFAFAVSNTADPNAGFSKMKLINVNDAINGGPGFGFADYPKFGITENAYVVTFDIFQDLAFYRNVETLVIDRTAALDPNPNVFQTFTSDIPGGAAQMTVCPVNQHNPQPGDPIYLIAEAGAGNGQRMRVFQMSNALSPTPTYTSTDIIVPTYQPVTPPVDTGGTITGQIDNRVFSAAMRGTSLVAAHNAGFGTVTRARWYEFDVSAATPTLRQSGNINQGPNVFTTYPSIDIAPGGEIGMTFIQSSSTQNMAVFVTGRTSSDPLGTMQPPSLVKAGEAAYFGGRMGDYSATCIDPVDNTFWGANEYGFATGEWGTWVGNFRVTPNTTISGTKFNDLNGNGARDFGEPGLAGWTIFLDLNTNGALDAGEPSQVTPAGGIYSFIGINPGTYSVREVLQTGWTQTTANPVVTVAAGQVSANNDFGNFRLISLSGFVFQDDNGNGLQDPADGGLFGWTIELVDASTSAVVNTLQTATNGTFQFTGVGPGSYFIRQVLMPGWVRTTATVQYSHTATSGQNRTQLNFGNFQQGIISGLAYDDINGNGIKDAGDLGLSGVMFQLLNPLNSALLATTVTDGTGAYQFTVSNVGAFRVREVAPTGSVQTSVNPGDVSIRNSGAQVLDVNFGNFTLGTITGQIAVDPSGLGTPGFTGIAGIVVNLLDGAGANVLSTQVSDQFGIYSFGGMAKASYRVQPLLPNNFVQTTPVIPTLAIQTSGTTIAPNGTNNLQVGAFEKVSLSGTVFSDPSGGGVAIPPLTGVPGIMVTLRRLSPSPAIIDTQVSDASGNFVFTGVGPGSYQLTQTLPSGFVQTTGAVNVQTSSGISVTGLDFGLQQLSTISGGVFQDINGNGQRDVGEPAIANRTITLSNALSGQPLSSATTDPLGAFSFGGLVPATYRVRMTDPAGTVQTTPLPGDVLISGNGENVTGLGIGSFTLGAINGLVFRDINGDGVRNAGEPGIANIAVELQTGTGTLITAGQTDGAGSYTFGNLLAGTYRIRQSPIAGNLETTAPPANLAITSGANPTASAIGDFQLVNFGGRVLEDVNGNSRIDAGIDTPLAGVAVQLISTRTSQAVQTSTTDNQGSYSFTSVGPGGFLVRQVIPAGAQQTTSNPAAITVTSGAALNGGDFGDYRLTSIRGRAFDDLDASGSDNGGSDPGLGGFVIQLYRDNNNNGIVEDSDRLVSTATTTFNGAYSFVNLGPGQYLTREIKQQGRIQTSAPTYVTPPQSGKDTAGLDFGNIGDANRSYVFQVYQDLLGRRVDPGGFAFWGDQLNRGLSRASFANSLIVSVEYRTKQVQDLYQSLLGRAADPGGLQSSVNLLLNTRLVGGSDDPIIQVKANILGSAEYFQRRGGSTNLGFLQALYQDVLNRPLDPVGSASFQQALAAGTSRTLVAKSVLYSTEGLSVAVGSYYTTYLRRQGDAGGISFYVSRIRAGATFDSVTLAFLTSSEYFARL